MFSLVEKVPFPPRNGAFPMEEHRGQESRALLSDLHSLPWSPTSQDGSHVFSDPWPQCPGAALCLRVTAHGVGGQGWRGLTRGSVLGARHCREAMWQAFRKY